MRCGRESRGKIPCIPVHLLLFTLWTGIPCIHALRTGIPSKIIFPTARICVQFPCIHYFTSIPGCPNWWTQFFWFDMLNLDTSCVHRSGILYTYAFSSFSFIWTQLCRLIMPEPNVICVHWLSILYTGVTFFIFFHLDADQRLEQSETRCCLRPSDGYTVY